MSKVALITGITGQTGSYLAEILLEKGYEVHGTCNWQKKGGSKHLNRIKNIVDNITLHYCDLTDKKEIPCLVKGIVPGEIYNLAGISNIEESLKDPCLTLETNSVVVANFLDCIHKFSPETKFLQASSAAQFGNQIDESGFQTETTPMIPVDIYGISKLTAHRLVENYRENYDVFCCNAICYSHESSRRGKNFVTQKIVNGAIDIKNGDYEELLLGNLSSYRDWSHAKDIAYGQYLMMQQYSPDDFILSSGSPNTVEEFCDIAFYKLGLYYETYLQTDPKLVRSQDLRYLAGNCSKAKSILNWKPEYSFHGLIDEMITNNPKYKL